MGAGKNQLTQLIDWDDENSQAARCVYANPDDPSKTVKTQEPQMERIKVNELNELKALEALRLSD